MTNFYIGLQYKPGIVDVPAYIGTASDGAAVDIELNINASNVPDKASALLLLEKLTLAVASNTWPPTPQAL